MVTDIQKLLSVKVGLPHRKPVQPATLAMGGVWIYAFPPEPSIALRSARHYSAKRLGRSNISRPNGAGRRNPGSSLVPNGYNARMMMMEGSRQSVSGQAKTPEEVEGMRVAGRLASEVLDYITPYVKPGVTTGYLDKLCHDYMVQVQGTVPAPLNYAPPGHRPYPKSVCTSVNHQVCHGVPGDKVLRHGDIVNIDVTVIKDGWHGDTSRMFYAGEPSVQARRLCEVTYEAMWKGIAVVRPGATLG